VLDDVDVGVGVEPELLIVWVQTRSLAEAPALAPVTDGVKSALYSGVPAFTSVQDVKSARAFSAAESVLVLVNVKVAIPDSFVVAASDPEKLATPAPAFATLRVTGTPAPTAVLLAAFFTRYDNVNV